MPGLIGRAAREPLVHFLVLGALIFGANAILHPPVTADRHTIDVSPADIARLRAVYAQQWGAPPPAAKMPELIDSYVRSEILLREGTALGLATDDSVVRNRVMQKMEFLLQSSSEIAQPTDTELQQYFTAHAETYRVPEQVAFTQIFLSTSLRGDHAEVDGRALLATLAKAPPPDAETRGDPFMLPPDPEPRERPDIEKDFGPDFTAALFALPVGSWQGPIKSPFGFHLVRVDQHIAAHLPAFSEVYAHVHDDLMAERFQEASDQAFAKVRSQYRVVLPPDAARTGTAVPMAKLP